MQGRAVWRGGKREKRQARRDLPKHWKDAQNQSLRGTKDLHPVNPAAGKSQQGEGERKKTEIENRSFSVQDALGPSSAVVHIRRELCTIISRGLQVSPRRQLTDQTVIIADEALVS